MTRRDFRYAILSITTSLFASAALAGETCVNGSCTNDWPHDFTAGLSAPTPSTSDNSTKVATTAFFVAQLGQPHTWSAEQTFPGGIDVGQIITNNLYYSGAWKYRANGFGSVIRFDPTFGGLQFYTAPSNSSGADAAASIILGAQMFPNGAFQLPAYNTAGVLTNDASGNVTTTVGVTDSGASCTITAITKGVITGASCAK